MVSVNALEMSYLTNLSVVLAGVGQAQEACRTKIMSSFSPTVLKRLLDGPEVALVPKWISSKQYQRVPSGLGSALLFDASVVLHAARDQGFFSGRYLIGIGGSGRFVKPA